MAGPLGNGAEGGPGGGRRGRGAEGGPRGERGGWGWQGHSGSRIVLFLAWFLTWFLTWFLAVFASPLNGSERFRTVQNGSGVFRPEKGMKNLRKNSRKNSRNNPCKGF